jgi:hypothetical protein
MNTPLFFCTYNDTNWNHHVPQPGFHACLSPVYGKKKRRKSRVVVPEEVGAVLVDSGAHCEREEGDRLSNEEALARQIDHAREFGYTERVAYLASYDALVIGKHRNGEATRDEERAVQATITAARSLASQRRALRLTLGHSVGLVLTAQGGDLEQYLRCTETIVDYMEDGDLFGLGGFAWTGKRPGQLLPAFCQISAALVPLLARRGIKKLHAWGILYPRAVGHLLALCDRFGLDMSSDNSGPALYPVLGRWGYASCRDSSYRGAPILDTCRCGICPSDTRCLGLDRCRHVRVSRNWFEQFRECESKWYRVLPVPQHWSHSQASWL